MLGYYFSKTIALRHSVIQGSKPLSALQGPYEKSATLVADWLLRGGVDYEFVQKWEAYKDELKRVLEQTDTAPCFFKVLEPGELQQNIGSLQVPQELKNSLLGYYYAYANAAGDLLMPSKTMPGAFDKLLKPDLSAQAIANLEYKFQMWSRQNPGITIKLPDFIMSSLKAIANDWRVVPEEAMSLGYLQNLAHSLKDSSEMAVMGVRQSWSKAKLAETIFADITQADQQRLLDLWFEPDERFPKGDYFHLRTGASKTVEVPEVLKNYESALLSVYCDLSVSRLKFRAGVTLEEINQLKSQGVPDLMLKVMRQQWHDDQLFQAKLFPQLAQLKTSYIIDLNQRGAHHTNPTVDMTLFANMQLAIQDEVATDTPPDVAMEITFWEHNHPTEHPLIASIGGTYKAEIDRQGHLFSNDEFDTMGNGAIPAFLFSPKGLTWINNAVPIWDTDNDTFKNYADLTRRRVLRRDVDYALRELLDLNNYSQKQIIAARKLILDVLVSRKLDPDLLMNLQRVLGDKSITNDDLIKLQALFLDDQNYREQKSLATGRLMTNFVSQKRLNDLDKRIGLLSWPIEESLEFLQLTSPEAVQRLLSVYNLQTLPEKAKTLLQQLRDSTQTRTLTRARELYSQIEAILAQGQ